jgi:ABC-type multidrug transport system fused ATPase/permease subunit
MLGEGVRSRSDLDVTAQSLCRRHKEEVLVPMKKSLFEQLFYTNSVDTYINFFSSFLTVIVVITMSNDAYHGDMDPSDFLGVFFVFKQLQKPAMKISGVLRSLIKKSANLERLNGVIFAESDAAATGPEEETGEEAGGNEAINAEEVEARP